MKIIAPLTMMAMFGLAAAGLASAATTYTAPSAAATATAKPARAETAMTAEMTKRHEACKTEASAKKLGKEARHEFLKSCMAGKETPATAQVKK